MNEESTQAYCTPSVQCTKWIETLGFTRIFGPKVLCCINLIVFSCPRLYNLSFKPNEVYSSPKLTCKRLEVENKAHETFQQSKTAALEHIVY